MSENGLNTKFSPPLSSELKVHETVDMPVTSATLSAKVSPAAVTDTGTFGLSAAVNHQQFAANAISLFPSASAGVSTRGPFIISSFSADHRDGDAGVSAAVKDREPLQVELPTPPQVQINPATERDRYFGKTSMASVSVSAAYLLDQQSPSPTTPHNNTLPVVSNAASGAFSQQHGAISVSTAVSATIPSSRLSQTLSLVPGAGPVAVGIAVGAAALPPKHLHAPSLNAVRAGAAVAPVRREQSQNWRSTKDARYPIA